MSQGIIAVATYRPFPGNEEELKDTVRRHLPVLRAEGLITEFKPLHLQAADHSIIEIFEWVSDEAKNIAHQSTRVRSIWEDLMAVADMATLSSLAEAERPFSNFKKLEL